MLAGAQVGELAGLRALVTGGASGIGLATARTFVAQGAAVAVVDREPVLYGEVLALSADVSDDRAVREAVATAVNGLGGLDILVNNAAIGAVGTIEDQSDEEWHHVLDVNVVGLVRVTRAALPALRASAHAAIVNLSSIGARSGFTDGRCTTPARAPYTHSPSRWLPITLKRGSGSIVSCRARQTRRGSRACSRRQPIRRPSGPR